MVPTVRPRNTADASTFRGARVANRNVAADAAVTDRRLMPRTRTAVDDRTVLLEMETTVSGVHIAMAARTRVFEADPGGADRPGPPRETAVTRRFLTEPGFVAHEFDLHLEPGRPVRVEKTVIVGTSRDRAVVSAPFAVTAWMRRFADPAGLLVAHEREWHGFWTEFAVSLDDNEHQSLALNLNTFHMLQTRGSTGATTATDLLSQFLTLAVYAATIALAYFDRRRLLADGFTRPFHWAWTFLHSGIYVIGRSVVLRNQAGRGLIPIWVWTAIAVTSMLVTFAKVAALVPLFFTTIGSGVAA